MSVLMGLSEYPLATSNPAQQPPFGYQWSNNNRTSPNSMGSTNNSPSPLNSNAPPMNNPTAPSPLIGSQPNMGPPTSSSNNQENSTPPLSNHGGTPPQQDNECPQVIKSPFDDELRCMPLNPQMHLPPTQHEHLRNLLINTRYNAPDIPQLRAQFPPSVNTLQGHNFITSLYPQVQNLNRSQCFVVQAPRIPPPPVMMPQQQPPAPAPPPPKKKRQTKKEKEEQKKREEEEKRMMQQPMMMHNPQMFNHMPPGQFMPGPMPGQMPMQMMGMDPNRPSSSEMRDPCLMSPNAMLPHMKGPDGFAVPGPVMNRFKPPTERIVEANHSCVSCQQPVSPEMKGIRCTASGMGCGSVFHASCVNINPDALYQFQFEQQCEWSCINCAKRRNGFF
ncbi:unnamed protein product [Bursaphelenchus xylophilus]|uniref:(pine wood nematode) hypothetical protein n=1 Tax=Bursaphelenchus xylophilus TaxID=6326 RepID=A0A1I7SQ32_BURXY|nr:unnamed protein product [Bursaphelenchus xylophilus]CAG9109551.1 unnamed protein product [Bursaphelenchus xylophilus]